MLLNYVVWDVDPYVAWPGEKMAKDADGLYYYVVPTNCPNIIFNNGMGGNNNQTVDIALDTSVAKIGYYISGTDSSGKQTVGTWNP